MFYFCYSYPLICISSKLFSSVFISELDDYDDYSDWELWFYITSVLFYNYESSTSEIEIEFESEF